MPAIPVTYSPTKTLLAVAGPHPAVRPRSVPVEIEAAVGMGVPHIHEAVARILELRVTDAGLLDGLACHGSRDRYTRHLVYAGACFSILALVWRPGQMSPIHGHRSWCAFGVRQGALVETSFTLDAGTGDPGPGRAPHLTLDNCRQLVPGMVSHADGDEEHYHRVANLGVETAVSIHVYGVAFDRLGHGLNRIWEDEL